MHAVGDVAHVALFLVLVVELGPLVVVADFVFLAGFVGQVAGPDAFEHLLANLAVEPAHTVDFLASFAEEGGHTEFFALVFGVGTAEAHEVVPRDAEACGELAHVFAEEAFVEIVVAGGHGGVDSVERRSTDELEGFTEVESALDVVYESLHVAEGGMTFVAVIDVFFDAEFLQGEHTTDAEQVFLLDAVFPVAAIEGVGDGAVKL